MKLPDSKNCFPKGLYLDQNKWVDLARIHYGRSNNEAHKDALDAIRSAVENGRLVVPMSQVHLMETKTAHHAARRRRLAEFMVEVSKNYSILPDTAIRPLEIRNALRQKVRTEHGFAIRPHIIHEGIFAAYGVRLTVEGLPAEFEPTFRNPLNAPATSSEVLAHSAKSETSFRKARETAVVAAAIAESARGWCVANVSQELRPRVELAHFVVQGPALGELKAALIHLDISQDSYKAAFAIPADYVSFFHSIPTIDVMVTLIHTADHDRGRAVHRNDAKDVTFLSVAIPYCNVVVLEKFWAHIVQSTGLDRKYGTVVMADLSSLRKQLTSLGCL